MSENNNINNIFFKKYLLYKKKYLMLKGGVPKFENTFTLYDETYKADPYLKCSNDITLTNLRGTCWALSSLMILMFGDSTSHIVQDVLIKKSVANILKDSLECLKYFLPPTFYNKGLIKHEKEILIIKLINYFKQKFSFKKLLQKCIR